MARLNFTTRAQLPTDVKQPQYDVEKTTSGIVHIGPGAFHRAHQAVYTDLAMAHGGNWRIDGVSMRSKTLKEKLAGQDNLYALVVLDNEPYTQIIGAMNNVFVLGDDFDAIMTSMTAPSTHIISLTITEKGYCLDNQGKLDTAHPDILHDKDNPGKPVSAIGLIVAALAQRKASGADEITIISCDNLSDNGSKLGAAVVAFAALQDSELADWIKTNIRFPNTMVDSITPATDEALVSQTSAALGVIDEWPIQREAFTQWVVEDKFSGPRPAWEKVGVTFTDDVHMFEKAKLRVLNGTHSTLAYLGSLLNINTVFEAISKPEIEVVIRRLLTEEILPTIDTGGKMDLSAYADDILKRYHNRHIRHLLSQIAWDGSQKLPFRILNTVRDQMKSGGSIDLLSLPIAAWILFIAKRQQAGESITDPKAEQLLALAAANSDNIDALTDAVLNLHDVFAELSDNQAFRAAVHKQVRQLDGLSLERLAQQFGAHKP